MSEALDDLDVVATLAASEAVRERRLAEVADLEVLAHWAGLHSGDPTVGEGLGAARARFYGNRLVRIGGEGTPKIQEFCLGEIALARGAGVVATRHAMADILDLRHRLPKTRAEVVQGRAEVWVARRVAKLSRHLSRVAVGLVDAAVARVIGTEAPGRVLEVAEAKIIEADPGAHQTRLDEEARRRFVGITRTDEHGLRTIIARVTAGDAHWIDATLCRVVEIIGPRHPEATKDEIRAIAFGWLARPAELLQLLLEHTEGPSNEGAAEEGTAEEEIAVEAAAEVTACGGGVDTEWSEAHQTPFPAAGPEPEPGLGLSRALAFPADLLDALRDADLSALRPKATIYVHLHQAAQAGHTAAADTAGTGGERVSSVARVEGLGSQDLVSLQVLLGHTSIAVRPVLDLNDRIRSTAYEHPETLKERVHLTTGGDYWPWAVSTSRNVDFDHPTPYDNHGPPGQTGNHNSGPLGRTHHRLKTFAGYRARQSGDCRYAWLTPHGLGFLVDHRGTRQIPREAAEMIIDAPPGVDIYPRLPGEAWYEIDVEAFPHEIAPGFAA